MGPNIAALFCNLSFFPKAFVMILATVGTQLPFDRLLLALDTWASLNPSMPVLAQTGRTLNRYAHLTQIEQMDQDRFAECVMQARVIVAHAGMGTILTALEFGKPLILMPRRADLGEHRNDHQRDTAAEMARLSNVTVVEDSASLCAAISGGLARTERSMAVIDRGTASSSLLDAVRGFIWSGAKADQGRDWRQ
jgi:UDP-N-acetylglucosamine transferase subunit ALG13